MDVSIINTSPDYVTVQTRGPQLFQNPWGPFQPENDTAIGREFSTLRLMSRRRPVGKLLILRREKWSRGTNDAV